MSRIERPLDPAKVRAADNAFYKNHPELIDENGDRIPLDGVDPSQASLRREWKNLYLAQQRNPDKPSNPRRPDDAVQPCPDSKQSLGTLVVHVRGNEGTGYPIAGGDIEIDGPESRTGVTDANGEVEFEMLLPGTYTITASKADHKPDPATESATVAEGSSTQATVLFECFAIELDKPFLIAKAVDTYMKPTESVAVQDDVMGGHIVKFGQDTTHATGRSAPNGQSVGTDENVLRNKMYKLVHEFAEGDKTGMAARLFNKFQNKLSSNEVFTDPNLDKAVKNHANFKRFAELTLAKPGAPGTDAKKTRIHQALKAASWDVNAVKLIDDLGVPAFNLGNKAFSTKDFDNGLGVMINGVQYVFVYVEKYRYHSCRKRYDITLKFVLYDVFGLDDDDLKEFGAQEDGSLAPTARVGITAWWQLQHQFNYTPPLTRAVVIEDFTVTGL